MKRFLLLAAACIAALAFALPAVAATTSFRGVVIAKDASRKSIVTVSRKGTVRTIRVSGKLKRLQVGRMVAVQAASLPDGTFAASQLRPLGRGGRAHFHANVAAVKGATLALSAGGSVFALRVRSGKIGAAANSGFRPGDRIDAKALVKGGKLQARREALKRIGHDDQLELEGIYLDTTDDGTIEMAVLHRGRVTVKVPDGVTVPDFAPGDEIVAVVKVEADGSFTLIRAENESSGGGDDGGGGGINGDGTFTVTGAITSLSVDRIFVQVEEHHEPVTCAVPADFDTEGFAVGDLVEMTCDYADGNPVLVDLEPAGSDDPPPPPPTADVLVDGPIDALTASDITVDGDDGPVTCTVPEAADLSAFTIDDDVSMKCVHTDAGLLLKRLQSDTAIWEG